MCFTFKRCKVSYFSSNHLLKNILIFLQNSTRVNGVLIHGETILHHGDRIALGLHHYFRLNCPIDGMGCPSNDNKNSNLLKHVKSMTDFNKAQEEVFLQNKLHNLNQSINESEGLGGLINNAEDENKSLSSTFSNSNSIDENGVALELAIQKFEHELNNKADFLQKNITETSSILFPSFS